MRFKLNPYLRGRLQRFLEDHPAIELPEFGRQAILEKMVRDGDAGRTPEELGQQALEAAMVLNGVSMAEAAALPEEHRSAILELLSGWQYRWGVRWRAK